MAVWPGGGAVGRGAAVTAGAHTSDRPTVEEAAAVAAPHSPAVTDATDRVTQLRSEVDQLRARLMQLRVVAFRGNPDVLPAVAVDGLARTRGQHHADDAAHALTDRGTDAQAELKAAEVEQRKTIADYFAALAAAAPGAAVSLISFGVTW